MFRILVDVLYEGDKHFIEAACNSGDTKPESNFVTGSSVIEADTSDIYLFDEEGNTGEKWVKVQ